MEQSTQVLTAVSSQQVNSQVSSPGNNPTNGNSTPQQSGQQRNSGPQAAPVPVQTGIVPGQSGSIPVQAAQPANVSAVASGNSVVLVGTNRDAHKFKHVSKPSEFKNSPELSIETWLERMDRYFDRMEIEDPRQKKGYLEDYIHSSLTADVRRFKEKPYEEFRKEPVRGYQTP